MLESLLRGIIEARLMATERIMLQEVIVVET